MNNTCFVTVSIQRADPGAFSRKSELGEFHDIWKPGITIGSDPGCTVTLPDLPPVAVGLLAASNHKLLYRLPAGSSLPLPREAYPSRYDERVDHREFEVGPYVIRFGEVYRPAISPPEEAASPRKSSSGSDVMDILESNTVRIRYFLIALIGAAATGIVWWVHLTNPATFGNAFHRGRVGTIPLLLALGPPFLLTFGLAHAILFKPAAAIDVSLPMSGYLRQEESERKWKIRVASCFVAAANLLLLFTTSSDL